MKKWLLGLSMTALILSAVPVFAYNGQAPISQGDFAVLLVKAVNAPAPQAGWNANSAASFLETNGISPLGGAWELNHNLNQANLAHVLRNMGLAIYSTDPDALVTWAKALSVLHRYDRFFQKYTMVARTVKGDTTTHIYTGVADTSSGAPAGPPPPASPSTP